MYYASYSTLLLLFLNLTKNISFYFELFNKNTIDNNDTLDRSLEVQWKFINIMIIHDNSITSAIAINWLNLGLERLTKDV